MKTRIVKILSAISLLMCLATVLLWARSYRYVDAVGWNRVSIDDDPNLPVETSTTLLYSRKTWNNERSLNSYRGFIFLRAVDFAEPIKIPRRISFFRSCWPVEKNALPPQHSVLQPIHILRRPDGTFDIRNISFSDLWIVLVTLALPLYRFVRARRKWGPGFCAKCGYDMRAMPDRCPECGTIQTTAATE